MSWLLCERSLQSWQTVSVWHEVFWKVVVCCLLETPICRIIPNEPNPEWSRTIMKVKKEKQKTKQEATLPPYSYRLPWTHATTPYEMFGFEERNKNLGCAVWMLKKLLTFEAAQLAAAVCSWHYCVGGTFTSMWWRISTHPVVYWADSPKQAPIISFCVIKGVQMSCVNTTGHPKLNWTHCCGCMCCWEIYSYCVWAFCFLNKCIILHFRKLQV